MKMTVEFKTERGEFLLVKVPDDATNFKISGTELTYRASFLTLPSIGRSKNLEGTYTLIGLVDDLTEEDWKGVVKEAHEDNLEFDSYFSYLENDHVFGMTPKESGKSLMHSLKVYEKNPYGESEDDFICTNIQRFMNSHNNPDDNSIQLSKAYEQAASRTGSWLLLKKIN